ncbi:MAG: hypothetical protein EP343_27165 [Deltaproteobacteria bacterium]|nr:MAG: hypothetical protein EP343_27165 [Deltaproteobacteria bacterium]
MMKRLILGMTVAASLLCLSFLSVGCGSNPCEATFNQQKACWANKDCSTLDGSMKSSCESISSFPTYADSVAACEKASTGNPLGGLISCKCEGIMLAAAQACEFDEATCSCKNNNTNSN